MCLMQYHIAGLELIFPLIVLLQWHIVYREVLILSALLTASADLKIRAQVQIRSVFYRVIRKSTVTLFVGQTIELTVVLHWMDALAGERDAKIIVPENLNLYSS